jgi:hypothetical protein
MASGSKIDLLETNEENEDALELAKTFGAPHIGISSKENVNCKRVLEILAQEYFEKMFNTKSSNAGLVANNVNAIKREAILSTQKLPQFFCHLKTMNSSRCIPVVLVRSDYTTSFNQNQPM